MPSLPGEAQHALDDAVDTARDTVSDLGGETLRAADRAASTAIRGVKNNPFRTVVVVAVSVAVLSYLAGVLTSRRS